MREKLQGEPTIGYGGRINGDGAYAFHVPAQNVDVGVLTNADSGLVQQEVVANKAAAIAIGKPLP